MNYTQHIDYCKKVETRIITLCARCLSAYQNAGYVAQRDYAVTAKDAWRITNLIKSHGSAYAIVARRYIQHLESLKAEIQKVAGVIVTT